MYTLQQFIVFIFFFFFWWIFLFIFLFGICLHHTENVYVILAEYLKWANFEMFHRFQDVPNRNDSISWHTRWQQNVRSSVYLFSKTFLNTLGIRMIWGYLKKICGSPKYSNRAQIQFFMETHAKCRFSFKFIQFPLMFISGFKHFYFKVFFFYFIFSKWNNSPSKSNFLKHISICSYHHENEDNS